MIVLVLMLRVCGELKYVHMNLTVCHYTGKQKRSYTKGCGITLLLTVLSPF